MKEHVGTDINKAFRESSWDGFIGFSVKAKDTEVNQAIHDSFREFCKIEADNNYTLGLKVLLEYFQGDMKYEVMWQEIQAIKEQLAEAKEEKAPVRTPDMNTGAF